MIIVLTGDNVGFETLRTPLDIDLRLRLCIFNMFSKWMCCAVYPFVCDHKQGGYMFVLLSDSYSISDFLQLNPVCIDWCKIAHVLDGIHVVCMKKTALAARHHTQQWNLQTGRSQ